MYRTRHRDDLRARAGAGGGAHLIRIAPPGGAGGAAALVARVVALAYILSLSASAITRIRRLLPLAAWGVVPCSLR